MLKIFTITLFFSGSYSFNTYMNQEETTLTDYEFEKNVPLKVDVPYGELFCIRTNGTIDLSTFSAVPKLEYLAFTSSHVDTIENGALCAKTPLKFFQIVGFSTFPKLTRNTFKNCKLEVLKLNKVDFEGGFMEEMTDLRKVVLSKINFEKYNSESFGRAENLKEIYLESCEVTEFAEGCFSGSPNLEKIYIEKVSKLKEIKNGVFENLNNLQELSVDLPKTEKALFKIDKKLLNGLKNLRSVKLNHAKLPKLDAEYFKGLTRLEILDLSFCGISLIELDTFKDLTSLKVLDLNINHLTDLGPGLFSSLPNLKKLSLNGNKLTTLHFGVLATLEELSVNANAIKSVDTDSLKKNIPNLKQLYIDWNPMSCDYKEELVKKMAPVRTVASLDPGFSHRLC